MKTSEITSSCCEVCDRNPTCGNDCGSCALDVCPTCKLGRYYRETGVVELPNECCAVYYFGGGSWAHSQWKETVRQLATRNRAADVLAETISADRSRAGDLRGNEGLRRRREYVMGGNPKILKWYATPRSARGRKKIEITLSDEARAKLELLCGPHADPKSKVIEDLILAAPLEEGP